MKIVVDTNIIVSGVFFDGNPKKIIESACVNKFKTYASKEILDEYTLIVENFKKYSQAISIKKCMLTF